MDFMVTRIFFTNYSTSRAFWLQSYEGYSQDCKPCVFAAAPCQATLAAGSWHSTRRKCCPWCEAGTANLPRVVCRLHIRFFLVKFDLSEAHGCYMHKPTICVFIFLLTLQAVVYVQEDEDPTLVYTAMGPNAQHRETTLGSWVWKPILFVVVKVLQFLPANMLYMV